jgi:hypothetical protein
VQGELIFVLAVHLVLTGLPGVAAALLAASRGTRQVPVLLAIALAASGAAAMLGFWAFYADPMVGKTFSFLVAFGSALLTGVVLHGRKVDGETLRALATPFGLWALGSLFLVFLGFAHGTSDQPISLAATRFSGQLPSDNDIPQFFSNWFWVHGHSGPPPPFPGEWLASDRPPLQIGYVLVERPFGWDTSGLHYQVLGVVLQQLWIVGLWALLLAARVTRTTRALIMGVTLVSGFAIVNGFFVWPKLLPAAMLLAAAALVLTPLWAELRRSLWAAALFAALCGLAMMGHGSSVFGIVPLLAIAALRGMPSWRWLGVAALVAVVVMAPWSAYQKYGDPPGNRLVKWTLAGVMEIDSRSTGEAIADAYSEAGVGGAIHYKAENFRTMAGGAEAYETLRSGFDSGSLEEAVQAVRSVTFYNLLPSLGLLLLGPIAMLIAWRRGKHEGSDWTFALVSLAAFLVGAVAWGLLVIGSEADRTTIHIGSYLVPILGICATVAGLRASFPRFAVYYLLLAALLSLAIYVPYFEPPAGGSYSAAAFLLAAAGLAGFVFVAFLPGTRENPPGTEIQDQTPASAALRGPRRSAGPRG